MNRQSGRSVRGVLVLLALGISLLFLRMIRSFVMALLLAAIFAGMTYPFYRRCVGWFRGREGLAAITVVVLMIFAILGPLTALTGLVVAQAVQVSRTVTDDVFVRSMYFFDPDGVLLEFAAWTRELRPDEAELSGVGPDDRDRYLEQQEAFLETLRKRGAPDTE